MVSSTDKTELSGRGAGPRTAVYIEVVLIEWLQVCLVSPVGQALQRGRNKEVGEEQAGQKHQTLSPHT